MQLPHLEEGKSFSNCQYAKLTMFRLQESSIAEQVIEFHKQALLKAADISNPCLLMPPYERRSLEILNGSSSRDFATPNVKREASPSQLQHIR